MPTRRLPPDALFLVLWAILIVGISIAAFRYVPWTVPWYVLAFVAVNLATFALYGLDKLLAAFQTRRVPERTLHLCAFLLGSPGALAAMQAFRHKTRKTSFQLVLALLVLVQVLTVLGAMYYFDPRLFS